MVAGSTNVTSGGRRGFAHRQKTPRNTSLVGWLRGGSMVGSVDIRLRFGLEFPGVEAGFLVNTDFCAVRFGRCSGDQAASR